MTTEAVNLPIIDLSSSDSISSAASIRQACIECGFFYLVNHGVEEELFAEVFDQSSNFFSLPLEDKLKLDRKHHSGHSGHSGYTALFSENLDFASSSKGDLKESYYVGNLYDPTQSHLNKWPLEDILPSLRPTMESYYRKVLSAGKRSTLHRVMPAGRERYSVAFFMDPNEDCVVECLESCCSEESPPRFPPVRSGDYLEERFRLTNAI
ncbi:hypothetical protein C1H46_038589 [Malus baccata]|uniref:Non-haem dioxygenase N-terminal domain-containing protein n=1 Tax=Malus baccata TaxID=106549 RepID=A0A540KNU2_MALBA|nr:hypothetical protein C1H46_038589 [Malus baccata]